MTPVKLIIEKDIHILKGVSETLNLPTAKHVNAHIIPPDVRLHTLYVCTTEFTRVFVIFS
jgi:hypothetical protein